MAKVTIEINGNDMNYDAHECEAKDFVAIINASIHHLEVEFKDKGEDVSYFISGVKKNLEVLEK